MKESANEIKRRKADASKPLTSKTDSDLELEIEDVYKPSSPLDIPIRPKWSYEMTKEQVENQEKNYFSVFLKYLEKI